MRTYAGLALVLGALLLAMGALPGGGASANVAGDASCDGRVDAVDAALVLQLEARLLTQLPCGAKADVNADGRVNSLDAAFVLQFAAGLIDAFPQCDVTAGPADARQRIDAAGAGTTVCLTAGTYSRVHVVRKTDLTIVGAGASTVVDDSAGSAGCVFVFESTDVTVEGLRTRSCVERGAFAASSSDVVFRRIETSGGPVGFQFTDSTGRVEDGQAHDHHRASPPGFGALINEGSRVTIDGSVLRNADLGVLARDESTLTLRDSDVLNNDGVGVHTLVDRDATARGGRTTVDGSRIEGNGLGVFAGVPGCADLPAADPDPPQCFLDDPNAFRSDIVIAIDESTVSGSDGTGIVLFPGVRATLTHSEVSGNGLTGLFAWGAQLEAAGNRYAGNVENAVECRAYPAPATGDRGMCRLTFEWLEGSLPLPGNVLGGGFVSEGGEFRLLSSVVEDNWGIGVSVHAGGKGEVADTVIRNNGGTAYCISDATWLERRNNTLSSNRPGECLGHP